MRYKCVLIAVLFGSQLCSPVWAAEPPFKFKQCASYSSALQFTREISVYCSRQKAGADCENAARARFKQCGFSTRGSASKSERIRGLLALILLSGSRGSPKLALKQR